MANIDIIKAVSNMVEPAIKDNNFELVDVEFVKEGAAWILRVYIDKEKGVNLDDCQLISEYLSGKLDENDIIKYAYTLEVSSPGIERIIKKDEDFERFKGETVCIKLYNKLEGKKKYIGTLMGLKDNKICINGQDDIYFEFDRDNVSKVNIYFEF